MTPEIDEKVHGIVFANRQMKVRELAEAAGISTDWEHFKQDKKYFLKLIWKNYFS